jgi:sugar lactone lactonase YvrE/enterochelin esterase-like enzyme
MIRRGFLLFGAMPLLRGEEYVYGPESSRQAGVPRGTVTKHVLRGSSVYPGTTHDYWVYVPAQYVAGTPAAVMVFQDGAGFVNETGAFRVPIVFDNLIHQKAMPVTIGIFISPGVLPAPTATAQGRFHRSYEYDAVTGRYARFLADEVLPEVGKSYTLTADPNLRAISGSSSGGNCSVIAVWERPDVFRRAVSFIGGFTHQRGALILPSQVRKFEGKPVRIFLQDGTADQNIQSNQDMIAALDIGGYDAKLVVGTEGHNSKHGGPLLPEALRWVWRDWTQPIAKPVKSFASRFVDQALEWELVGSGYGAAGGLTVDKAGDVYFVDGVKRRGYRVDHASGKVGEGKTDWAPEYFVETGTRRVLHRRSKRVVHEGITAPAGVCLSPDHSLLFVSDAVKRWVWSFQVQADGSLQYGVAFHRLEIADEEDSGAAGLTVDTEGFLYVCTRLGLQINDPAGRTSAVLLNPNGKALTSVTFGGPGLDTLYVTAGDSVFRRKTKRQGVFPWAVLKPPVPRL